MAKQVDVTKIPTEVGECWIKEGFMFYTLVVPVRWHYVNDCLEDLGIEVETEVVLAKSLFKNSLLAKICEFDINESHFYTEITRILNKS